MKYISVCSGIEAATTAWHPLGFRPLAFSEIEAFPRAVLAHHYPNVPCHGDFTTMKGDEYGAADLLVGGTPCQSFSIAGLRGGLADDRGNLALEYLRLADRGRFPWIIWENVPGVLSSNGGRDFGTFLGALGELGYGWAYRVLDAQYFGVAQRRRRVFVVGYLGDWRRAAAVLFERHSLSGHPAPSRETGEGVARWPAECAPTLNAAFGSKQGLEDQHVGGGKDCLSLAQCLTTGTGQRYDPETETLIPTRGGGFDVAQPIMAGGQVGGNQGGDYVVQQPVAFDWQSGGDARGLDPKDTVQLQRSQVPAAAFGETARTLSARHDGSPCADRGPDVIAVQSAVRRLTPRECERLQGFPDDWTLIPWRRGTSPDGPRYKALGNSMAVPVMRWIGERIQRIERGESSKPSTHSRVAAE